MPHTLHPPGIRALFGRFGKELSICTLPITGAQDWLDENGHIAPGLRGAKTVHSACTNMALAAPMKIFRESGIFTGKGIMPSDLPKRDIKQ